MNDRTVGSAASFSETKRQVIHMSMGAFALLLRVLTWWQAALCAVCAFLFNLLVLPKLAGPSLYRPVDAARGYPVGILIYPLSVLLLIVLFPERLDIVAAAWGVMAVGDGAATLVGRRLRSWHLPWNPEKTAAGTAAFVVAGGGAAVLLAWWTRPAIVPAPPPLFVALAPLIAASVAAFVETLPVRLDDNISVPFSAAAVLWGISLMSRDAWMAAAPDLAVACGWAVLFNAVVAALGWRAGTVSGSGAVAGAAIGVVVMACAGWQGWMLLFAAFFSAAASSRIGLSRKTVLGIAEERGGRRGPGNAIANCGLAAAAALLAVLSPYRQIALLAAVAALVAGASDTVASEIGKVWGRRTVLLSTLARVRPGTPGAISLEGTAAGVLASAVLATLAVALGLIEVHAIWWVVVAAALGSTAESLLAATLEGPGIVNNDLLNFVNTGIAATVAVVIARLLA